jgi:hypothetical protein
MTHAVRSCIFTLCLAVLSAGPAFTQASSSEAAPATTVSAADVANVYVGTSNGVLLYHAASNGKLTLVSGSPFSIAGSAVGSNRKYFVSLDPGNLYSYPVLSNGAIGPQAFQINTQDYALGDNCLSTTGADFDHSGQKLYVQLAGASNTFGTHYCNLLQSFEIASNTGSFTFLGSTSNGGFTEPADPASPLATISNDAYAYDLAAIDLTCYRQREAFQRQSNGTLDSISFTDTQPVSEPGWNYVLMRSTEAQDPSSHLAAAVAMTTGGTCGPFQPPQLVSYTVDNQGNVTSTNTWQNAPASQVYDSVLSMSPSGKLLAVGGNNFLFRGTSVNLGTNGLRVFHFNGANPITPYSKTLTTAPIDQIHWDETNHLYALSDETNKLYVYTVTPTSISEAPGSPYTISGANALVVVANLCYAPAAPGVAICVPTSGSSVSSPVLVEAASKVTGTIVSTQLWVDGVKNFNAPGSTTFTTSVSLAAGTHRFAVIATNTAGQKWESTVTATVK